MPGSELSSADDNNRTVVHTTRAPSADEQPDRPAACKCSSVRHHRHDEIESTIARIEPDDLQTTVLASSAPSCDGRNRLIRTAHCFHLAAARSLLRLQGERSAPYPQIGRLRPMKRHSDSSESHSRKTRSIKSTGSKFRPLRPAELASIHDGSCARSILTLRRLDNYWFFKSFAIWQIETGNYDCFPPEDHDASKIFERNIKKRSKGTSVASDTSSRSQPQPSSSASTPNSKSHVVTLLDPSTNELITSAVRSKQCPHLECFDLQTHLNTCAGREQELDYSKQLWACPVPGCTSIATIPSLEPNFFLQSIIDGCALTSTTSVRIYQDGTWTRCAP